MQKVQFEMRSANENDAKYKLPAIFVNSFDTNLILAYFRTTSNTGFYRHKKYISLLFTTLLPISANNMDEKHMVKFELYAANKNTTIHILLIFVTI